MRRHGKSQTKKLKRQEELLVFPLDVNEFRQKLFRILKDDWADIVKNIIYYCDRVIFSEQYEERFKGVKDKLWEQIKNNGYELKEVAFDGYVDNNIAPRNKKEEEEDDDDNDDIEIIFDEEDVDINEDEDKLDIEDIEDIEEDGFIYVVDKEGEADEEDDEYNKELLYLLKQINKEVNEARGEEEKFLGWDLNSKKSIMQQFKESFPTIENIVDLIVMFAQSNRLLDFSARMTIEELLSSIIGGYDGLKDQFVLKEYNLNLPRKLALLFLFPIVLMSTPVEEKDKNWYHFSPLLLPTVFYGFLKYIISDKTLFGPEVVVSLFGNEVAKMVSPQCLKYNNGNLLSRYFSFIWELLAPWLEPVALAIQFLPEWKQIMEKSIEGIVNERYSYPTNANIALVTLAYSVGITIPYELQKYLLF